MNKNTPIIIVSPRQNCGGGIVLHGLAKILFEKGYNAKIFIMPVLYQGDMSTSKFWIKTIKYTFKDTIKLIICKLFKNTKFVNKGIFNGYSYKPIKKYKRKYLPFVSKKSIVIYPEACYGNLLKANNIVRWLLYYNRFPNDKNAYGKNELFMCYRKIFNDEKLNPDCKILKLNNFDYDLYKQVNFDERSGKCYMIRKGKNRSDLPLTFDGPILDSLPENKIVESFNKYKYCYFYDTQTFYSSIAAICGCIPILICEANKSRKDYLSEGEPGYGKAYGETEEEINFAINTRDKLIERINGFKENNDINVENFIKECEKYFH